MKGGKQEKWQTRAYPRMVTTWRTGQEFLDNYQPGSGPGKFFIPYKRARDLPAASNRLRGMPARTTISWMTATTGWCGRATCLFHATRPTRSTKRPSTRRIPRKWVRPEQSGETPTEGE